MDEDSRFSVLISYVNIIFLIDVILFVVSAAFSGFKIGGFVTALFWVALVTLFIGLWIGTGYSLADLPELLLGGWEGRQRSLGSMPITMNKDREFVKSVERRQFAPHLDEASKKEIDEYGTPHIQRGNTKLSICLTMASLLAMGSSYLIGRMFPG